MPEHINCEYAEIPAHAANADRMEDWLRQFLEKRKDYQRLVVYRMAKGDGEKLHQEVRAALNVCRRHEKSDRQWMRVVFVFDPAATWSWLSLPTSLRQELEDRADAVISPHKWNLAGLSQALKQKGKLDSEEICKYILQVTGGWPTLINLLFERSGKSDDPRPVIQSIRDDLLRPDSELARQLGSALGLDVSRVATRVFDYISKEREALREWVTPENVGGEPALTLLGCQGAIEFCQRLGCIESVDDALAVDPVVAQLFSRP